MRIKYFVPFSDELRRQWIESRDAVHDLIRRRHHDDDPNDCRGPACPACAEGDDK
jgi:CRISPR/Cas system-associated exonuclease Cas4 (RecB family)